ncbi:MAG: hypothetical protein Q4G68_09810 [Planctomycetia bacterium]|nr:hypothetical protein [Planctomycetia bacterium]
MNVSNEQMTLFDISSKEPVLIVPVCLEFLADTMVVEQKYGRNSLHA